MAASEYTWVLTEILAEMRLVANVASTNQLSADNGYKRINDYYRNRFPLELEVDLLRAWFTQSLAVSDSGKYSLGQTVLDLRPPITVDNKEIVRYHDFEKFFRDFPEDEQYVTDPTLAIGTTDSAKVKNSAFVYELSSVSYSKASAETAFDGLSTVPQNKYGAFSLIIDDDGTITIGEADDNSTGYNTAGEAVDGLGAAGSDEAYMGYVTVISTDAGGFVPGTTALDDAAVTDTYTDGKPSNRGTPSACCIYDEYLYVRPKPDRIYQFKSPEIVRPDALDTTDAPLDIAWGPLIATGAALEYLGRVKKDVAMVQKVGIEFSRLKGSIENKLLRQNQPQYAESSFL